MTEREKIIKVIKQASEQAYADFHELFREGVKRVRDGEISRFTNRDVRPTHDEILADKLIEAGIGDVTEWKERAKKHRVRVLPDGTIKQLYSAEEVEDIDRQREDYKHRAEVAERALFCICKKTAEIPSYMVAIDKMERLLRQAEKQLAEEKKQ